MIHQHRTIPAVTHPQVTEPGGVFASPFFVTAVSAGLNSDSQQSPTTALYPLSPEGPLNLASPLVSDLLYRVTFLDRVATTLELGVRLGAWPPRYRENINDLVEIICGLRGLERDAVNALPYASRTTSHGTES